MEMKDLWWAIPLAIIVSAAVSFLMMVEGWH